MLPKELYIDQFKFIPQNSEDEIEVFICEVFNKTGCIDINEQRFIFFNEYGMYTSHYSMIAKLFNLGLNEILSPLGIKTDFPFDKISNLCKPIFERHFKFKLKEVL